MKRVKCLSLLLGGMISLSCAANMESRWIVKVTSEADAWPNDEQQSLLTEQLSSCGVSVSSMDPSGVPGFYRLQIAQASMAEKQRQCVMAIDMVESLTEDGVMRHMNSG
ncbi:hypothetical protein CHH28_18260 [Bacterioplanes sanyensis]|uniref:SPOR domain-containing protein n=1 Tax=Bacterioplanes sanyensis TaxID=1249553 RepID=A0A222FQI7_9GAMM|nr:hypothetical protein [Bacterioplanes sanyensis]ASP40493.1 hypothetical protein CHH28_18260 [Bacterioplanes sanyensis]